MQSRMQMSFRARRRSAPGRSWWFAGGIDIVFFLVFFPDPSPADAADDEAAAALRDDGSGGGEETDEGLSRDHWYMSHLAAAQMTKDVLGNS